VSVEVTARNGNFMAFAIPAVRTLEAVALQRRMIMLSLLLAVTACTASVGSGRSSGTPRDGVVLGFHAVTSARSRSCPRWCSCRYSRKD
jgi:hypothetical protein